MKRRYVLSPRADRDVDAHFLYIAKQSREAAVRFLAAADISFQRLAAMPELGERQDFGQEKLAGLRVWQVQDFPNYVIFYRPIEEGLEIVRVLHSARDVAAIFEEEV